MIKYSYKIYYKDILETEEKQIMSPWPPSFTMRVDIT